MILKTDGLILREVEYRDSDKLLTVLTRERGKLTAAARGVRSSRSKLKSACQLLTFSEFTLEENRGRFTVRDAAPREMFQELRDDLDRLSLASYFVQVADCVCPEDLAAEEMLSLTLNALYALSRLHLPQSKVKAAFELRTACLAGYLPQLQGCAVCGNPFADRFNVSQGVLQCAGCRSDALPGIRLPVGGGALDALRYITECAPSELLRFSVGPDSMKELADVAETYLATQLERGFSALEFYKSISPPEGNIHDRSL